MYKRLFSLIFSAALLAGCAHAPVPSTAPSTAPTDPGTQPSDPSAVSTVPTVQTDPTVPTEPESPSILDFLSIATLPVGRTMYVWGGGWNEADTGAGPEATTLGVSPRWEAFAQAQTSDYDYMDHRYQIHDGLDCSGYVGWAVYNVMEKENGRPGYVTSSTKLAGFLADRGLGRLLSGDTQEPFLPGDIVSMPGHCYIVVGSCADGSVLLLHASPPAVMFSGTTLPDGSESQASRLAEQIMSTQYPDHYSRFPHCARPHSYLTNVTVMRWQVLADPQGLRQMDAQQVCALLFSDLGP